MSGYPPSFISMERHGAPAFSGTKCDNIAADAYLTSLANDTVTLISIQILRTPWQRAIFSELGHYGGVMRTTIGPPVPLLTSPAQQSTAERTIVYVTMSSIC